MKNTIPDTFFTDPVDKSLNEQLLWRHAGTQGMPEETQTGIPTDKSIQVKELQPGSSQSLTQEQRLRIEKNHLEARARKTRLMSMRNAHTVLTQKQIEQIHCNRLDALLES